jgi:hypothetical protein
MVKFISINDVLIKSFCVLLIHRFLSNDDDDHLRAMQLIKVKQIDVIMQGG